MSMVKKAIFFAWIFLPLIVSADVLRVPNDYNTIQAAINAASNGDTVLVADGTFKGLNNRDIDFNAKAITLKSQFGPKHCIIDCGGSALEPHRAFFFHSGEGSDSILEGFTIINGSTYPGGAIYCEADSNPTIAKNIIQFNAAFCPT